MDYQVEYRGESPSYITFSPDYCDSKGNYNSNLCFALLKQKTPEDWHWDKKSRRLIGNVDRLKRRVDLSLGEYVSIAQDWVSRRMDELMRFNFCRRIWEEAEKEKGA